MNERRAERSAPGGATRKQQQTQTYTPLVHERYRAHKLRWSSCSRCPPRNHASLNTNTTVVSSFFHPVQKDGLPAPLPVSLGRAVESKRSRNPVIISRKRTPLSRPPQPMSVSVQKHVSLLRKAREAFLGAQNPLSVVRKDILPRPGGSGEEGGGGGSWD